MNVRNNNQGFSLVELMVVVAIIGMLAAVAVPQFSKFQAKSRQAEAKANLSALYAAEKSFNGEHGGYASNLRAIGFSPTGELLYNLGFSAACASWAACSPQYGIVGAATHPFGASSFTSDATVCAAFAPAGGPIAGGLGCRMRSTGAPNGAVGPILGAMPMAATVTTTTFTAGAIAQIMERGPTDDRWTINQDKQVSLVQSGIP